MDFLRDLLSRIGFCKRINPQEYEFKELRSSLGSRVFAIDGGNSLILDGGNWLLNKVRIAAVGYDGLNLLSKEVVESYFGLVQRDKLEAVFSPVLGLEPSDDEIKLIELPPDRMEEAINIIRRLMEWKFCLRVLEDLIPGDILLMDSLLDVDLKEHEHYVRSALELAEKKGVILLGFAKTCRLRSADGRSLLGCINEAGSQRMIGKTWVSEIDDDNEGLRSYVIKLHANSSYVYRLQASKNVTFDDVSRLVFYSSDPELLGYPYPLIRADYAARVGDFEKRSEQAKLNRLSKEFSFIEFDSLSSNFHARLDERAYKE